jgi:hypothetical protein
MAKGDKEHQMLFDLRGKRRNVVKVVYATLAVLMGLSLFLVIGGFNIAELFNDGSSTGNAAEPFEEQAERLEAKLKKEPENTDLLVALTRAQINTGNAQVSIADNGEQVMTLDSVQSYQQANDTWAKYLKATDEPATGLAQLMGPALFRLAETSRSVAEARRNVEAATEAQKIVAEQRPNINSYSTLAYYMYFTGDFAAADKAADKAKSFTNSKVEREAIEKQLGEVRKTAKAFDKEFKEAERQAKAGGGAGAAGGGEAAPESFEEGESPLGEAFGGGQSE